MVTTRQYRDLNRDYVQYKIPGPYMNASVPPNQVQAGSFGRLVGVDPRFNGCARKFYGMKEVVDLDDVLGAIDTYDGVQWIKHVVFQKRGTSTFYRGFVVLYDTDDATYYTLRLFYTLDNGTNWSSLVLFNNTVPQTTTDIDCIEDGAYLYVCVDGLTPLTVYYESALVAVSMGPGSFTSELAAMTAVGAATDGGTTYYLEKEGTYQVAFRFYSSTRGVYSAMSARYTFTLGSTYSFYTIELAFPDSTEGSGSLGAWEDSGAGFSDLFDTVDVFRSINLGDGTATDGAILYLEQTIDKVSDWDTNYAEWDALTVDIGTVLDEALVFQTQYNPETDIVTAPPTSGTIGRYQGTTLMAQTAGTGGGVDTLFSSLEHVSGEYFSTYNKRTGDMNEGRPMRYLNAGDSAYILASDAVVHVFKASKSKPLQFVTLHLNRGLISKNAAHTAGNSVFMITGLGLVLLNGQDGSMGQVSSADRVIFDDWKADLDTISSGYDSRMNTSYFLNPTQMEVLQVGHSTQSVSILEGARFAAMTHGQEISTGKNIRAYFCTEEGLIVTPDYDRTGTGTMTGLDSSYTINGQITGAHTSRVIDSAATIHADMVGARVYITSGTHAGESGTVTTLQPSTGSISLDTTFSSALQIGDTYAISPVPWKIRLWPLRSPIPYLASERFRRWNLTGVVIKSKELSGFTDNPNNDWRCGGYRNGGSSIADTVGFAEVSLNPADSSAYFNIDGIDIEPYLEQISCGTNFELTNVAIYVTMSESRNVS